MKAVILEKREVARDCFELVLETSLPPSKAGQFVMVRVSDGPAPLLRRPMSIAGHDGNRMSMIFRAVGKGTAILAGKKEGDLLDVIGPFGNFFARPSDKKVVMVGGGVGIPPLLYFARQNSALKFLAVIGGRTADDIFGLEELEQNCEKVIVTTEDGSMGQRGLVIDPLKELDVVKNGEAWLAACGPTGMLKAVDELCGKTGVEGALSVEEKMACGFGVCLGCICDTVNGRKRVCVEGPIFRAGEIKWRES